MKWTLFVAGVQLAIGVYGGYFGAGIGVLMLAGLSFAGLDNIHQMNAMKVLLATLINGAAVVVFVGRSVGAQLPADRINWGLALGMVVASVFGGFFGMRLSRKISQGKLRGVILGIGMGLTIVYFWKAYG